MAALFPAPDVVRAVADRAYFDVQIDRLADRPKEEREAFIAAVVCVWNSAHAPAPDCDRGDEPAAPAPELSYEERRVLTFAAQKLPRFRTAGAAEQAIRWEFGFSATRYYQVLGSLIDRPEAREYAPAVVNRLQARRTAARARRCTAGLGRAA